VLVTLQAVIRPPAPATAKASNAINLDMAIALLASEVQRLDADVTNYDAPGSSGVPQLATNGSTVPTRGSRAPTSRDVNACGSRETVASPVRARARTTNPCSCCALNQSMDLGVPSILSSR